MNESKITKCLAVVAVVVFLNGFATTEVYADRVTQLLLGDYNSDGTVSDFSFQGPPNGNPNSPVDSSTTPPGNTFGFTDDSRCLDLPAWVVAQPDIITGRISTFDDPGWAQLCLPLMFDAGAIDLVQFSPGFLFGDTGVAFAPVITTFEDVTSFRNNLGDPNFGDIGADITIDQLGVRTLTFDALDFAGGFGSTIFKLPPTTLPIENADPANPATIPVVDPSLVDVQALDDLGSGQFGTVLAWTSKIYQTQPGSNVGFNDAFASWRLKGTLSVTDDKPIIFLNGAQNASIAPNSAYTDAGAVCQDVVDGQITAASIAPASFSTTPANPNQADVGLSGSFTVTYNCTDSAGITADAVVRTVTIQADTTPPVITLLADPQVDGDGRNDALDGSVVDILTGQPYIDAGASCLDDADGAIALGTAGSPSFTLNPQTVDTSVAAANNLLTFSCSDSSGNTATLDRVVNVLLDSQIPVLTLNGASVVNLAVGDTFVDQGAQCSDTNQIDTLGLDISANVNMAPLTVDTSAATTQPIVITYTCLDAAGNAATPITREVNVVGGQGFEIISMTITDLDNDGLAGCFKFHNLNADTCTGASRFSTDNSVIDPEGGNTIPGPGTDLDANGLPIGVRFGVFQDVGEFSQGFIFSGFPFVPFTFDSVSSPIGPPSGVVAIAGNTGTILFSAFPFGGKYSSNKPNDFYLAPDPGTLSAEITAINADDDGTTRTFNYTLSWSHLITLAEDPTNSFVNVTTFWRLEGVITTGSQIVILNDPPEIREFTAAQDALNSTRIVMSAGGIVTVTPDVVDPEGGVLSFDWSASDGRITPQNGFTDSTFSFDPAGLAEGVYKIRLAVADDATDPGTAMGEILIEVMAAALVLDSSDTDGDGTADDIEGFGDTDNDGIPNFRDTVEADAARNRVDFSDPTAGEIVVDAGKVTLGADAFSTGKSRFTVTETDIGVSDPVNRIDGLGHSGGGIFDFTASGLPVGGTVRVVLPQAEPLPSVPVYRKYTAIGGWRPFTAVAGNALASTMRVAGDCPDPTSAAYDDARGLVEGDDCVRVTIVDGGANDGDTLRNGIVVDPGTISGNGTVPKSSGGCAINATQTMGKHMDWLLLTLFVIMLAAMGRRFNRV